MPHELYDLRMPLADGETFEVTPGRQPQPIDTPVSDVAGPVSKSRRQGGKLLLAVTAGMAVAGVVVGIVWTLIAPPIHMAGKIGRTGKPAQDYLAGDENHLFDAAVMMIGLLTALGIISAVLLWQWRRRRGPGMVIALTVGGVAAAGAATGCGAGIARIRYGHTDVASLPADSKIHYFTEAPPVFFGHTPLQVIATLVLPAAMAALTYAVMAAASAYDDLGVGSSLPETVP
jgi:uncharacterized protein DUF2567